MLDLARVRRDLESPVYGSMAHAVDTLMRVIRADGAVALVRDKNSQIQGSYVGSHGLDLTPEQLHLLRKWTTDPRSTLWHQADHPTEDDIHLLAPDNPADAKSSREIAQAMIAAGIRINAPSLRMALPSQPPCVILFLRRHDQPPFVPADTDRLRRFTTLASRAIQQGHRRELRRLGRSPATHNPVATLIPAEDLLGRLSATELRVLQRLQLYETERQAAVALGRSPNTIHVHVKSIYRKMMVTSRKQLLGLLGHDAQIAPDQPGLSAPKAMSA